MLPISLPYIYDLSLRLEALNKVRDGRSYADVSIDLFMAQYALEAFLNQSVFAPYLRVSRTLGENLLSVIYQINEKDAASNIEFTDEISLRRAYDQYKTALHAELNTFPAFFVTVKGGYDTLTLLNSGAALFPNDLPNKAPDAVFDIQEACKCLAFEVSTASGFHVFRATESILRRYYAEVTAGAAPPKVRGIRVYVRAMRQAGCGNPKVLQTLDQMADLHRNPLMHPEDVLTTDEAIAIIGIARSVITEMLAELPEIQPTTTFPTNP